jgi:hypothetical protein
MNLAKYWLPGLLFSLSLSTTVSAQPAAYPRQITDDLLQGCVKSLSSNPNQPAPANVANTCKCSVNQIQTRIPLTDYQSVTEAIRTQKALTPKQNNDLATMSQSVQSCKSSQ